MKVIHLLWLLLIFLSTNFLGNGNPVALVSAQCQRDQQSLLLQMKNSFVFSSTLSVRPVQWNQSTDCCTWSGVDCDMAGRVIGLDLSWESVSGVIDNSSGLFGLWHLQSLNLAFNDFYPAPIPSRLANLTNLIYLNLSSAGFSGQIPIEIASMTRLATLDLSCTYPIDTIDFTRQSQLEIPNLKALVQNLTELRELYLDEVNILAKGTEWSQALSSSLPNLQVLSLISCDLSGLVQNLTKLRELYLDGVNISAKGTEWSLALSSSLTNLQVLSLTNCNLSGPIHSSLTGLHSLSVISLDCTSLSSPIPDFFTDFPKLKILSLRLCELSGKLPENIIKVSTLETLRLDGNPLLHSSLPDFPLNNSLSALSLPDCNLTGPLPTSMANLTQLVDLDLSSNYFTGPIPYFYMPKSLKHLDLSFNVLIDGISSINLEHFPNLVHIDLSYNFFNGSVRPALFVLPMLRQLRLANNQLEGQFPDISNASSSVLEWLDLRDNRLEGPIPESIYELKNLESLDLSSNKFNGTVQLDMIGRLDNLSQFYLSYNNLTVNGSSRFSSFLTFCFWG